ncbi:unnamed protein product [Dibothriocephalus latus]|uniref:Long-chain-fatty-acid--CoA ligase n=1 Tax=Dibothriocephalus latus TaxID=60516 RepID=A0A3P7LDH9_DIBLA|nr:unnamed protein product [Dibothriocephalus latus]
MGKVTGKVSAKLFWIVFIVAKFFFSFTWDLSFYVASVAYLITGGWRFVRIFLLTIRRDIFALSILLRISAWVYFLGRRKHGLREVFASVVRRRGRDTIAMRCQDEKWTFGDMDDYSNQIANVLRAKGIEQRENIALFMESCARYSATWLGAAKESLTYGAEDGKRVEGADRSRYDTNPSRCAFWFTLELRWQPYSGYCHKQNNINDKDKGDWNGPFSRPYPTQPKRE